MASLRFLRPDIHAEGYKDDVEVIPMPLNPPSVYFPGMCAPAIQQKKKRKKEKLKRGKKKKIFIK